MKYIKHILLITVNIVNSVKEENLIIKEKESNNPPKTKRIKKKYLRWKQI
jgi:hypothetical protein